MKLLVKIKAHEAVQDVFRDSDGWWVWLYTDWVNPELECSQIHEQTLTGCLSVLRGVKRRDQWMQEQSARLTPTPLNP